MAKYLYLSFLFLILFHATPLHGQTELVVEVKTDDFPFENYWRIQRSGSTVFEKPRGFQSNTISRDTFQLDSGACYSFIIFDLGGNGMCCADGDGYFRLSLDGNLLYEGGEFGFSDFTYINCDHGKGCISAISIEPGRHVIQSENEKWYSFRPDTTGKYNISTCSNTNICPVKIWCYDQCNPTLTGRGRPGTLFFSENTCGNQAEISATLFKDSTYIFRIGADPINCVPDSIEWYLSFEGIASGCTNPLACNFDPTAVVDDGSCLFSGDPDCPEGPDLSIDEEKFKTSLERYVLDNGDACLLQEGCIKGYGTRTLIRFDTWIDNIGSTDYFVGNPPEDFFTPDPIWEYDICHNHWHYEGYASYHLYDENGQKTPVGFKNGFCVMDVGCYPGNTPAYFCQYQGISAGCYDLYDKNLDCQWIDITDVSPGEYTLVTQINTLRNPDALGRQEQGFENNWAQVCIEVLEDEETGYKGFVIVEDCDRYVDCLGTLYGDATIDCNGTCGGTALQGDIDGNEERNSFDVIGYLQGIVQDSLQANQCLDLNQDDNISVTDAVLLLECALHDGAPQAPGHIHVPCEFPYSIKNPFDSVWMYVTNWQPDESYFELAYLSPYAHLAALQLSFDNLNINQAEVLLNNYRGNINHGAHTLTLHSFEEDRIPRNQAFSNLIRVYYSDLEQYEICPQNVTVVNDLLEEVIPLSTNCLQTSSLKTEKASQEKWELFPNPSRGSFQLFNSGGTQTSFEVSIFDSRGKKVFSKKGNTSQIIQVYNLSLSPGTYFYRLHYGDNMQSGRFAHY